MPARKPATRSQSAARPSASRATKPAPKRSVKKSAAKPAGRATARPKVTPKKVTTKTAAAKKVASKKVALKKAVAKRPAAKPVAVAKRAAPKKPPSKAPAVKAVIKKAPVPVKAPPPKRVAPTIKSAIPRTPPKPAPAKKEPGPGPSRPLNLGTQVSRNAGKRQVYKAESIFLNDLPGLSRRQVFGRPHEEPPKSARRRNTPVGEREFQIDMDLPKKTILERRGLSKKPPLKEVIFHLLLQSRGPVKIRDLALRSKELYTKLNLDHPVYHGSEEQFLYDLLSKDRFYGFLEV